MKLKVRMRNRHGIKYLSKLNERVNSSLRNLYQSNKLSRLVISNTLPVTPMKTGQLRKSGKFSHKYSQNGSRTGRHYSFSNFVKFRAINPITGFNYAYIQEVKQHINYTTPGTHHRYLQTGIVNSNMQLFEMNLKAIENGLNHDGKTKIHISRDYSDYFDDEDEQMRLGFWSDDY